MVELPHGLDWWRDEPGGAEWLDALPRLVLECAAAWELDLGAPFEPATISFVAPATLRDGREAVLKVNFPEPESEHEGPALRTWGGAGAVALLGHDPERRALLVERCEPGTQLWQVAEEEANLIAADVLRQLWRASSKDFAFRLLADEAARWVEEIPAEWEAAGRPFERSLVKAAVGFLREVGPAQGDPVLLHGDFHGGNVLRSARGWLGIDPKPLAGEREFDPGWLVVDCLEELTRDLSPRTRIARRLDMLSSELGLDRGRIRGWGLAHVLAWGFWRGKWDEEAVSLASWIAEA